MGWQYARQFIEEKESRDSKTNSQHTTGLHKDGGYEDGEERELKAELTALGNLLGVRDKKKKGDNQENPKASGLGSCVQRTVGVLHHNRTGWQE